MGSLVMVGVGTLQSLACAIFPGSLSWAGKLYSSEHWEKLCTYLNLNHTAILLDWKRLQLKCCG